MDVVSGFGSPPPYHPLWLHQLYSFNYTRLGGRGYTGGISSRAAGQRRALPFQVRPLDANSYLLASRLSGTGARTAPPEGS